jgi:hypothetical protein
VSSLIDQTCKNSPALLVRHAAWVIVGVWVVLWIARLAVGDDLTIRDQERQCAYILDAWSTGRWSAQTDFLAAMASKPPLYNWLGAASVALFGPGQFAFTIPAAAATLFIALLAWHWARKLSGPAAGLLAGLLTLLPMVGLKMVANVRTDGLFAAAVALTAYLWWQHWEGRGSGWWPWLAGVLATLTKGPLGLLLGSFGLLAIPWQSRAERSGRNAVADGDARALSPWWPAGLALYLALSGAWLLWAWLDWGQPLIERMIDRELVGHAVAAYDSSGGFASQFWKPSLSLLWRTAPWCAFTILALVRVFRHPDPEAVHRRAERFLTCWLLAGLAVFSFGSHQRGDLIWPLVTPAALLAAREILRRAASWPQWARTRLGPALLAVTMVSVVANQVVVGQPKKSLYAHALAQAIAAGPGRDFPLSYDVKYSTLAHLGIHRYLAPRARYVAALAGDAAVYVAVEDPRAVIREVAAAGGHATELLATRSGWGIVGNRRYWEHGPSLRLLMGPVEILVEHADWQSMHGRQLRLVRAADGEATVVIVNNGPFREPFVVRVQGVKEELAIGLPPHTQWRATWRATTGWRQSVQPSAPLIEPWRR